MKASEMKELDKEQLNTELNELYKEQFNLRVQKATGQLTKTHNLRRVRRAIARAKTIAKAKDGGNNE